MRSRRSSLVALAALAAAVLWIVVWLGRADDAGRARDDRADSAMASATAEAPAGVQRDVSTSDADARRAEVASTDSPPVTPAPSSRTPRGVELIALHAITGERVARPEFVWWPQRSAHLAWESGGLESLLFEGRLDEVLDARALALSLEDDGRVFAPAPDAAGYAIVSSPGLWGHVFIGPRSTDPTRVLLYPDDEVRVRVVDRHGAPVAGARVALRSYFQADRFHDRVRAFADEDGVASLRHIRAVLGEDQWYGERHRIALVEPLRTPVFVEVELDALPAHSIELIAPATGVAEVEVLGVDAAAERGELLVNLAHVADDGAAPYRYPQPRRLENGVARFPAVELGGDLLAWIVWPDSHQRLEEVRGPAPVRTGELVRLVLRSERNSRVVRGRLVDANGPLIQREFELEVGEGADAAFRRTELRTNAEGRFDCELGASADASSRIAFHVQERGQRVASAFAPLSFAPVGVATDLGDVRVEALEEFLSGVVLEGDANAAGGASVSLFVLREAHSAAGRAHWETAGRSVSCDGQGRFRFTGAAPLEPIALRAEHRGRTGAPQRVERGRRDLVLRVDDTGVITGQVLVPSATHARRVSVEARATALDGSVIDLREARSAQLEHDGRFEVIGLCSGSYELEFRFEGLDAPLALLRDVVVSVGSATGDARLAPLDLRDAFDFVSFDVRASDGRPIEWGTLGWRDGAGEMREATFQNGRLLARRSWGPGTAWIFVDEHLLEPLDLAGPGGLVKLRRAPTVRLRLPPDAPAIGEGLELWAVLCAEGDEFLAEWIDNSLEFSGGVAEGLALRSGETKVELWIGDEFALECSKSISVAPSAAPDSPPQEFELELSLDELRRAIDTSQR